MIARLVKLAFVCAVLVGAVSTAFSQSNCAKNDYDCYAKAYRDRITANSKDVEAYYGLGWALQNKGDYAGSIPAFDVYLSSGVTNTEYLTDGYSLRGFAHRKTGNYDKAIADYTRAIGYTPTKAYLYYRRGLVYQDMKQFDPGIADFSKALSLDANNSSAVFARGYAYMEKKDYPPAIADFTRMMALDPTEAESYYNRGTIYYRQAKYALAVADLDKYIAMNAAKPAYLADGYLNRGLAHHYSNNFTKAVADFTKAIELQPSMKNAYSHRAMSYKKLGKTALAAADEAKAATLN